MRNVVVGPHGRVKFGIQITSRRQVVPHVRFQLLRHWKPKHIWLRVRSVLHIWSMNLGSCVIRTLSRRASFTSRIRDWLFNSVWWFAYPRLTISLQVDASRSLHQLRQKLTRFFFGVYMKLRLEPRWWSMNLSETKIWILIVIDESGLLCHSTCLPIGVSPQPSSRISFRWTSSFSCVIGNWNKFRPFIWFRGSWKRFEWGSKRTTKSLYGKLSS